MIHRFSSRRKPLDASFLNQKLADAKAYDRIAGYFSSSILEVAGEQIEALAGKVRIVCNSQFRPAFKGVEAASWTERRGCEILHRSHRGRRQTQPARRPDRRGTGGNGATKAKRPHRPDPVLGSPKTAVG